MQERGERIKSKYSIISYTKEQPTTTGRRNEDAFITLEDERKLVGFIDDGGTALSTITSAPTEAFDGYFAATTSLEGIRKNFATRASAKSLLIAANNEIGETLKRKKIDPDKTDSEFLPTCGGASVILIDKRHDETQISQIGDTAVLVIFKNGKVETAIKPSINNEDIKAYKLARKLCSAKGLNIAEALNFNEVTNMLILGRHKENILNGYGSLNGKGFAARYINSKMYKTSDISRIVAFTDGAFPPTYEFDGEPEWKSVAKDVVDLGLEQYFLEKVYKIKESDPELLKYPRFKKHDDASILEIILS